MSEKGQSRKSMFSALKNMEELRRLYDSDTPVLAYAFKRRMVEGWTPEQSMPFAFSARLSPTGRVRRRIRTATRRGEFGGLDTDLCPRPIVSEFTGVCQCANKTVSLGGSPPGFASRCVRTVPKPYPFEPLGLALERKADSPSCWKG